MELWPSDKHRLAYMTSLLVFQYCLPLVLVLLCYLRIFLRLKRRRSHSQILIFLNKLLSQHICPPHSPTPHPASLTATVFCFCFRGAVLFIESLCLRSAVVFHSELSDNRHHGVSRRDMLERSRRTRGAQRINVMLLAIVVAFALCWLPLNVFNTLFDWHHQALPDCQHDAIFSACHLTAMASTCINPVVYGFLNSNFQKELKSTLQQCQCSGGATESYESFPLSTMGSEGLTKATSLNRMGSVCVLSARPEISTAIPVKTIPGNT